MEEESTSCVQNNYLNRRVNFFLRCTVPQGMIPNRSFHRQEEILQSFAIIFRICGGKRKRYNKAAMRHSI